MYSAGRYINDALAKVMGDEKDNTFILQRVSCLIIILLTELDIYKWNESQI